MKPLRFRLPVVTLGPTLLALALALLPACAAAQAPDLSQPPRVGPIPSYQPPASVKDQLPNGLHLVVVRDTQVPLLTLRFSVRAGSSQLQPADAGLADATASLLTAGIPGMNARQIAEYAAGYGGQIRTSAGSDFITARTSGLASLANQIFALFSAVILHPTFPASEVALRKSNMLQELQLDRSNPGYLARVRFSHLLWGSHPYAIVAPTEASIARISCQSLLDFHRRLFLPNNQAVLVITGDIDPDYARSLAQQYFGDWHFGNPPNPPNPAPPTRPTRRIFLVDRPGSAQSTIWLGNLGLTRLAPQYFPLLVANEVLGGSFNSRLVAQIREQKGYAYFIYSHNDPKLLNGAWWVETQVRTAVTADTVRDILTQLDQMRSAPVTASELSQAQGYLAGSFIRSLETQAGVADQFLTVQQYHLPGNYLSTWVRNVDAVSSQQALAAARAIIHPNHELVVVVGDVKTIEHGLVNLQRGMMTIYNAKGEMLGTYPPSHAQPMQPRR